MRRRLAILGSAVFLAPGMVAGVVPFWLTRWRFQPPLLEARVLRVLGAALMVFGAAIVLDSFRRFAWQGMGTPAPLLPTSHLVVTGLYRNPMYVGVAAAILGQGLLFGDNDTLAYGVLVWVALHLFVFFYEEPTLRHMFGEEYETFCRNVPRWIPHLHPWQERNSS
ncbi:MAG TPA: isoprenylcysteine carboxylmethyltransferase family protein [Terriglobales bacterium]|nr:isoprenylcysteine carboxylmethyltransferase family protein [Terriglobales bacterium]